MGIKYPCVCCSKPVKRNQKALACTKCGEWVHIKCDRIPLCKYNDPLEDFVDWQCCKCLLQELPFWDNASNENNESSTAAANTNCDKDDQNIGTGDTRNGEFPYGKGMKIAHVNIRSLRNKVIDVQYFLTSNQYDLFSLSETWLDDDICMNEISCVPGYKFVGKHRGSLGGGVGCYIKENISYLRREDLESDEIELMWLEIKRHQSSSYFVGVLYRKPSSDATLFFNILEQNMDNVFSVTNNIIILGDFNCNMMTNNRLSDRVNELRINFSMRQMINDYTRVSPNSKTLIDLILVSDAITCFKSGVQTIGISDHSLVYLVINGNISLLKPQISRFRSFRTFDEQHFKEDLNKIVWSESESDNDVEHLWQNFKAAFQEVSDKHAPYVTVRRKQTGVPWINDEYIQLARQRDYFHKKSYKTNEPQYWEKFKHFRNKANNLNRRLKKQFYQKELEKSGNDVGQNWRILKNLLPSKKNISEMKIIQNDEFITDKNTIAEILNKAFNEFAQNLAQGAQILVNNVNSMNTLVLTDKSFVFEEIKEEFVLKELQHLDVKKACGVDGLHLKILKKSASYIAKPLTKLFNKSLETGQIPKEFKKAKITPIHKGGTFEPNPF